MQQGDRVRVLDCTPLTQESESVAWLTGHRVTLLGGPIGDCTDPHLAEQLAANGYTHLLVRRDTADGPSFTDHPASLLPALGLCPLPPARTATTRCLAC